jgi:hypothetical protein
LSSTGAPEILNSSSSFNASCTVFLESKQIVQQLNHSRPSIKPEVCGEKVIMCLRTTSPTDLRGACFHAEKCLLKENVEGAMVLRSRLPILLQPRFILFFLCKARGVWSAFSPKRALAAGKSTRNSSQFPQQIQRVFFPLSLFPFSCF